VVRRNPAAAGGVAIIVARGPRDEEIAKMRGQKITGLRYFPAVVDFLDIRKASGLRRKVRIPSRTARPLRNLPNGLSRLIKRKDLRHRRAICPFSYISTMRRFIGAFAVPAGNPMTRSLPLRPIVRSAASVQAPPTGSMTTSIPSGPATDLIAAASRADWA
jgi:hypothetical protein